MGTRTWQGVIPVGLQGRRLDQALAELPTGVSRAEAQRLIRQGSCQLGGSPARASLRVAAGMQVRLEIAEPQGTVAPERAPLTVLHEDGAVIVVNKPPGMAAHPARGTPAGTLLNALAGHLGQGVRPTLVHRLDRDTSGALLAAKSVAAHRELKRQMEAGELKRVYWALVWGRMERPAGTVEAPLRRAPGTERMAVREDGKPAVTRWRVLAAGQVDGAAEEVVSLLEVSLQTGRTHQIRVHMEWLGHPLVGERVYRSGRGEPVGLERSLIGQALHSRRLEFRHPATGEPVVIEAELPEAWRGLAAGLLARGL